MTGQSGIVDLHVYPDGFELIEKLDTPRHRSAEILASAIGGAIGAPVAPVIAGMDGSIFMPRLPGEWISSPPGELAAMEAVMDTADARKLGLLDLLIRNSDRGGNWQRDGDHIYGFDHAPAFVHGPYAEDSPFVRHYVRPAPSGSGQWYEFVPNDLSRSELDGYEERIRALRPLFEEHARMDWAERNEPLEWHDNVLSTLGKLRAHATRP